MTRITITITMKADPGDLIFDLFKEAYNLLTNVVGTKRVIIHHNDRQFTIEEIKC